jgi:hypothetical protein
VRRILIVLALLSCAAAAQAAQRPLACAGDAEAFALAGENALAGADGGVFTVPAAGGSVRVALPAARAARLSSLLIEPRR